MQNINMSPHKNFPIFVYGTLMLGERNHVDILQKNLLHHKNAEIQGQLHYYEEKDFPALTVGTRKIEGQLFYFDNLDTVMAFTHKLEGYIAPNHQGNMYHLELAEVETEDNELVQAFVYRVNPHLFTSRADKFSMIQENAWKTFKNR